MKLALVRSFVLAGAVAATLTVSVPRPAAADTGSTAAIAAAALIVGGLIFDSSRNQYYYVSGGHRRYVDNNTASYRDNHGSWHGNGYHDPRGGYHH